MRVCKRILAGLVLLLGTAVLLLSLAGGVGVWIVKGEVAARATSVFGRIEKALDVAEQGLDHAEKSLAQAAERLDRIKEEQGKLAREPRQGNMARRLLAQTVVRLLPPEFGDAQQTLHTVAEAAVVINSVLEDVGTVPFLTASGLDTGQLTEVGGRLTEAASSAWELSRLLGDPAPEPNADPAGAELSRIELALKTMQGLLAEYQPRLGQVRQRTEELKARTFRWIALGPVLVSLLCFWMVLSQVSLLAHAWSWWKQARQSLPSSP